MRWRPCSGPAGTGYRHRCAYRSGKATEPLGIDELWRLTHELRIRSQHQNLVSPAHVHPRHAVIIPRNFGAALICRGTRSSGRRGRLGSSGLITAVAVSLFTDPGTAAEAIRGPGVAGLVTGSFARDPLVERGRRPGRSRAVLPVQREPLSDPPEQTHAGQYARR